MEKQDFQKPTVNGLTEKAMMNMHANQIARNKASKYVRLEDSEERIYEFDPEDIQIAEPIFDGKKTLRFEYAVKDELGNTQIFTACKKTSKNIDKFLIEGTTFLKIKRVGTGIDTSYYVTSV
jgi:hypothetical protein